MEKNEIRRLRLRQLIDEGYNGKVAHLATRLGMKPPQLSRWLNNKQGIHEDSARGIERECGLHPGWLDLPPSDGPGHPTSALLVPGDANVSPAAVRKGRVPVISWVQAGDWSHAADLLQPGEGLDWVDTSVSVQAHTFALRVDGDSMEPEFSPGTIVVVEPDMEAYPGDYVIAKNGDDEATFKQLVRDGADLYLKPLNPRYPIKPLAGARIVGVVREAVKRYR